MTLDIPRCATLCAVPCMVDALPDPLAGEDPVAPSVPSDVPLPIVLAVLECDGIAPVPEPAVIDGPLAPSPLTVADLLADSRAAHIRYRQLHDATRNSDTIGMRMAIEQAVDLRRAAVALDPTHTDPAWAVDIFDGKPAAHADLISFYETFLKNHA